MSPVCVGPNEHVVAGNVIVHRVLPLLLRTTLTWPVGGGFPGDVATVTVAAVDVPTWVGLGASETKVTRVTAGGAYELLRDALVLVPGLDDAELVTARAGLRPGTPDDLPLVGPSPLDGLVVATGHYRNGILLTPITAEAVVAAVAGEPLPPEMDACDPRRFEEVRV